MKLIPMGGTGSFDLDHLTADDVLKIITLALAKTRHVDGLTVLKAEAVMARQFTRGFTQGRADGHRDGYEDGYSEGLEEGKREALDERAHEEAERVTVRAKAQARRASI